MPLLLLRLPLSPGPVPASGVRVSICTSSPSAPGPDARRPRVGASPTRTRAPPMLLPSRCSAAPPTLLRDHCAAGDAAAGEPPAACAALGVAATGGTSSCCCCSCCSGASHTLRKDSLAESAWLSLLWDAAAAVAAAPVSAPTPKATRAPREAPSTLTSAAGCSRKAPSEEASALADGPRALLLTPPYSRLSSCRRVHRISCRLRGAAVERRAS